MLIIYFPQEYKHYWTELRGTTLFFYSDKKSPTVSSKTYSADSIFPNMDLAYSSIYLGFSIFRK